MKKSLLAITSFIFLTACSGTAPAATLTPTAAPLPTETPTLMKTPTLMPSPTPSLPPEFLAGMTDAQKLDFAPVSADGYTKAEVYLDGSVILYRDQNQAVQSGYDLATGEWLNQEQVYDTMLTGAGLTPDNTWDTSHATANSVESVRGVYAIFPDPNVEIRQTIEVDGEQFVVMGKNIVFYDMNTANGESISHRALAPLQIESVAGDVLNNNFACDCQVGFPQLGTTYRLTYTQKPLVIT